MYGLKGVDIILNSTGGDVNESKWYKYNQVRAIENNCYNFVTMGGKNISKNYVFGFNQNGKNLIPQKLNGLNLFVFNLNDYDKSLGKDKSFYQDKTECKIKDYFISNNNIQTITSTCQKISDNLYLQKYKNVNMIFVLIKDNDIYKPEKILKLLYNNALKEILNKRYIILNQFSDLSEQEFISKLSVVLKVRAMENYCAVILDSNLGIECYQTGKTRTVQVVKNQNNMFGLDLSRMSGAETIWKNKPKMLKAYWRENFEKLISYCNTK